MGLRIMAMLNSPLIHGCGNPDKVSLSQAASSSAAHQIKRRKQALPVKFSQVGLLYRLQVASLGFFFISYFLGIPWCPSQIMHGLTKLPILELKFCCNAWSHGNAMIGRHSISGENSVSELWEFFHHYFKVYIAYLTHEPLQFLPINWSSNENAFSGAIL